MDPSAFEEKDDNRKLNRFNCHNNTGTGAPSREAVLILVGVAMLPYNHLVSLVVCQSNSLSVTGTCPGACMTLSRYRGTMASFKNLKLEILG